MKIILTAKSGSHEGQKFVIEQPGTYYIGRSPDVDWSLPEDNRISRRHCKIEVTPEGIWLSDLQSTQGTFVNSQVQQQPTRLAANDTILIGFTSIIISVEDSPQKAEANIPSVPGFTLVKELPSSDIRRIYWALPENHHTFVILHFIPIPEQLDSSAAKAIDKLLLTASITSKLGDHPGILSFRGQGRAGQVIWFATGFVNAIPLTILGKNQFHLSLASAVDAATQMIEIVSHLHQNGVIHRSLNPDSFWIQANQRDSSYQVYLTDLTSAKWQQVDQLQPYTTTGKAGYRLTQFTAPETLIDYKTLDPRSDVYALGAVLYYLFSGQMLYDVSAGEETLMAILEATPVPLTTLKPELPPTIINIIEKAMARDINVRFETAKELSAAWCQTVAKTWRPLAEEIDLVALHEKIARHFNLGEIRVLCFQLNIEYENIEGDTRTLKALMLVKYCQRHGLIHELVAMCQRKRPNVDW